MDYISVKEAAQKWGITERRIQKLCVENLIKGVIRLSKVWAIPKADKPKAARFVSGHTDFKICSGIFQQRDCRYAGYQRG